MAGITLLTGMTDMTGVFGITNMTDRPMFELTCMTAGGSEQFTVALFWICILIV